MILYTLHPGAESDLDAACRRYKEKACGLLIARYPDEFDRVASLLVRAPGLGTLHHHEFHPPIQPATLPAQDSRAESHQTRAPGVASSRCRQIKAA